MKKVAAAGVGIVLALTAVPGVALAHSEAKAPKLVVKVSPTKNVKPGHTIKISATHAVKKAGFYCALVVINDKHRTDTYPDPTTFKQPTSSAKGTFSCNEKFTPFKGVASDNTKVSCPVSKKLKKTWSCAVVVADVATQGKTQLSVTHFTAK
jgi:hypothetical protein